MGVLRSGTAKILEAQCGSDHDEDDEDVVFCNCPFFRFDEGERICLGWGSGGEYPGPVCPTYMTDMTKEEVLRDCPLKKHEVLVRLKE